MKFLPKLLFRKDESFEYAEKIENLIKQTNKQEERGMNKKAQELAMHDKDTGSSEIQIALLTEKIEENPFLDSESPLEQTEKTPTYFQKHIFLSSPHPKVHTF